jgi:hypothetical protein
MNNQNTGGGGGGGGGAARGPSFSEWYGDVASRTGVVSRYVLIASGAVYLASWLSASAARALLNCPSDSIARGHGAILSPSACLFP